LSGRLVAEDESRRLRETIDGLMASGFVQFVLNLRGVSTLDSGGVGSIVAKYLSARRAGGDLKLASLSTRARYVLAIAGLLKVFDTFDNEELAVASFHPVALHGRAPGR
jgi:anti-sigma B factor antagonist